MDENCAWFCVTDESTDVYDLDKFPFVWTTQFEASEELIILPLWSLIQLSKSMPKTNDIIMLFNSARCGSTLACQMFYKLPKTKSMSEPWIGTNLNTVLISGQLNCHDVNALVKACIYLQCKQSIKEPFERIIFKPSLTASAIVSLTSFGHDFSKKIQKIYQNHKRQKIRESLLTFLLSNADLPSI